MGTGVRKRINAREYIDKADIDSCALEIATHSEISLNCVHAFRPEKDHILSRTSCVPTTYAMCIFEMYEIVRCCSFTYSRVLALRRAVRIFCWAVIKDGIDDMAVNFENLTSCNDTHWERPAICSFL